MDHKYKWGDYCWGAIAGAGAVIFAPAVVALVGDGLAGLGLATGFTTIFSTGMMAYGASTALENAITGISSIPPPPTPNEIGALGEQKVGENLPINIQQQRIVNPATNQTRIYDGNFRSNPNAYVEVKTSTRGVVNASSFIRNQINFDANFGADSGILPTWIFVNARPSGPLINLMRQGRIPWHQLNVPWE